MEAVQFDVKNLKVSHVKVPLPPAPGPNEVVVKVHYSGVCGTDVSIISGKLPCLQKPVTMGHEFCGVVSDLGSDVKFLSRGDKVVVDPNMECSLCEHCRSGLRHLCQVAGEFASIGIWSDGGWAQYAKVPDTQVYRLPDGIPMHIAALCEPLSCVAHGWDRLQPLPMGSRIMIQGAGIIGMLWLSVLHHQGQRHIWLTELQEGRREIVKKLGMEGVEVVHPDELHALKAKQPSWGVDVCIDTSGSAPAVEAAMSLMKPGGKVIIFGIASPQARASISTYEIYKKELTILGTQINPFTFHKSMAFLEAMGEKYLDFSKLGIKVYKLSQHADAINDIKKGVISKAMFQVVA